MCTEFCCNQEKTVDTVYSAKYFDKNQPENCAYHNFNIIMLLKLQLTIQQTKKKKKESTAIFWKYLFLSHEVVYFQCNIN